MRCTIATIAIAAGCSHASPPPVHAKPPPASEPSVDAWLVSAAREPRARGCALETVSADEAARGSFEPLGFVQVHLPPHPRGGASPETLSLAQPRACQMGGDAISQVSYDEQLDESSVTVNILYEVWAHPHSAG